MGPMAKPTRCWWLLQRERGPGCTTTDRPGTCKEQLDTGGRDCPQCGSPAWTLGSSSVRSATSEHKGQGGACYVASCDHQRPHSCLPARAACTLPNPRGSEAGAPPPLSSSHLSESRQGSPTPLHTALWAVSKVTVFCFLL